MKRIEEGRLDIAEDDRTTRLEEMITPDDVIPKNIREYPAHMELSEKMYRICRNRVHILKDDMQVIEDKHLTAIEEETVVVQLGRKGYLPEKKKKFSSEIKRQRELRIRLADDRQYQKLKVRMRQYDEARASWRSHCDRLRRDLRQLEIDYASNGGMGVGL